jgi:hypothetical protein
VIIEWAQIFGKEFLQQGNEGNEGMVKLAVTPGRQDDTATRDLIGAAHLILGLWFVTFGHRGGLRQTARAGWPKARM